MRTSLPLFTFALVFASLALTQGASAEENASPNRGYCARHFAQMGIDTDHIASLGELKTLSEKKGAEYFNEYETVGSPDGEFRKLKIDDEIAKQMEKDYQHLVRLRARYENYNETLVQLYLKKTYGRNTPPPEVIASFALDGTPRTFKEIQDELRSESLDWKFGKLNSTKKFRARFKNIFHKQTAKDLAFWAKHTAITRTAALMGTTFAVVTGSIIANTLNPFYTPYLTKEATAVADKANLILTAQKRAKEPLDRADQLAKDLSQVEFTKLTPEQALETWHHSEEEFAKFYREIKAIREASPTAPAVDPNSKQNMRSLYFAALEAAAHEAQFKNSQTKSPTGTRLANRPPSPIQEQEIATLAAWKLATISDGDTKGAPVGTPSETLLEQGIEAIASHGHLGYFVLEFVALQRQSAAEIRKAVGLSKK